MRLHPVVSIRQFTIDWIDPFGQIFIRLLKFIAVPLVLFSIISGISGLNDITKLGRMGGKTLGLYLLTTVLAVNQCWALLSISKSFPAVAINAVFLKINYSPVYFSLLTFLIECALLTV